MRAIIALNDILFIISHWVFVYYYLKVSLTVPVYFQSLNPAQDRSAIQSRIKKITLILRISTASLFLVTTVLYSLSVLEISSALTAIICLTIPLLIVSVVLIYSICRIKEEINYIITDTYLPNNGLMCLHVTFFSMFALVSMSYISLFTLN